MSNSINEELKPKHFMKKKESEEEEEDFNLLRVFKTSVGVELK